MNLNEYQSKAMKFAKYTHCDYPFLALSEEAGEVSGKLAKYMRKNNRTLPAAISGAHYGHGVASATLKTVLKKELGDVLWQLQACAYELGFSLEEIARDNLDKLSDRDSRGVIVGEGDDR